MQVKNYELKAANGKHIRIATKVVFSDGREVRFLGKLTKREALRSAFLLLGRQAYNDNKSSAPIFSKDIQEAIKNLRVGDGAELIMRAYSEGWHQANLAARV